MTTTDITETLAPKSDQQNYDDYMTGIVRTVTVTGVHVTKTEQPVSVDLAEFPGRPYKPSKTMRRVLAAAWGPEGRDWIGRRLELYGDPKVKFGGQQVGGIKIRAMSDLAGNKPLKVSVTVSKGKKEIHTVQPIADAPAPAPEPSEADVAACTDQARLQGMWHATSSPEMRAVILARKAELDAVPVAQPDAAPDADADPGAPWGTEGGEGA